jgi:hypothetical protein
MAGNGARAGDDELAIDTGRFVAAAVLMGVGGLLLFIGAIIGSLHAISEGTRLVGRMDTPPNELAKHHMNRLTLAAKAGADAWTKYGPPGAAAGES